jgi:hypothetical protein
MTIPRFADDLKAEVLIDDKFEWNIPTDPSRTSTVRVRLTLLPKEWRLLRGWGNPTNVQTRERKIHKNEGISILRANREIFYGILPKFYPSAVQDIDRWHGIEISFEPDLDECFRVRNVKKGAEPVEGLRAKLKEFVDSAVNNARKRIKNTYTDEENKRHAEQGIYRQLLSKTYEKIMITLRSKRETDRTLENLYNHLRLASRLVLLSGLVCVLLLVSLPVHGQQKNNRFQDMPWLQFRGPESNPVGTHARLAERWSKTENVEWSQEIPGPGGHRQS